MCFRTEGSTFALPLSPSPLSSSLPLSHFFLAPSSSPVLVGGKVSQLANHLTSQLKPTSTTAAQRSDNTEKSPETSQASSETGLTGLPAQEENDKSTATQALEASTLLQQQGGGEVDAVSGVLPSITAELIAQCFLNLPNSNSTSVASPTTSNEDDDRDGDIESIAMATDATVSAANVLAALGSLSQGMINSLIQGVYPYT